MAINKKGLATATIAFIIIGIIALIGLGSYFTFRSNVTSALLKVNSGNVMVDSGNGYESITGEVALGITDKVKTGEDGRATLVLFESFIQIIDPNTELSVEKLANENPKIKQAAGTTWNKFTSLTGMKSIEVETPTSVAIVRGTGYTVELDGIKVIDGTVQITTSAGDEFMVEAGRAAVFENGTWIERNLTAEEITSLIDRLKSTIPVLKDLRSRVISDNKFLIGIAEKAAGMSETELQNYLEETDNNLHDVQEIYDQSPVKSKVVVRIAEITRAIQDENKLIANLTASQSQK
jgi:uncharacterized cupin superfamily protein